MSKVHHNIDYVEFPAGDLSQIKAFYGNAFGWTFEDYGPHYIAPTNAGLDAGFQGDKDEAPAKPLLILYSIDLEHSLESVTKNGGKITQPIFDFPGGRRFHFRDPSGNELAVWSDK